MDQKADKDNGHNNATDIFTKNMFNDLSKSTTETGFCFHSAESFKMQQLQGNVDVKTLINKIRYSSLPYLPATSTKMLIEDNISESITGGADSCYRLETGEDENLPSVSKDYFTSINSCPRRIVGCDCLKSDDVAEPICLRESEKFHQKQNFSFFPHNGILFNYCQPVNKSYDNLDTTLKAENEEMLTSDTDCEELITVIDCDDIDDISSDNFYPPIKHETPKKDHVAVCTENFNELEKSRENESGDSKSNSLNISENKKCGQKKNTFCSRFTKPLTNLFRSKKKNPPFVLESGKII